MPPEQDDVHPGRGRRSGENPTSAADPTLGTPLWCVSLPVLRSQEQNQGLGAGGAERRGHRIGGHAVVAQRAGGLLPDPGAIRSSTPTARSAANGASADVAFSCSAISIRSAVSCSGSGTAASRTTDRCAVQSARGPVRSTSASYSGWSPIVSQSRGYRAALRHPHAHTARRTSARGRRAGRRRPTSACSTARPDRSRHRSTPGPARCRRRVHPPGSHARPPSSSPTHQHTALSPVPTHRLAGSRPRPCRAHTRAHTQAAQQPVQLGTGPGDTLCRRASPGRRLRRSGRGCVRRPRSRGPGSRPR
ncbi:hypothetical protein EDD91_0244 [Streptomyces sp. KS 21]|nr:hypothetical protein EDD91_0244 [Streptomyces sp. KS 21]